MSDKAVKTDANTIEYYEHDRKIKSVLINNDHEITTYFTGKGRREKIKKIIDILKTDQENIVTTTFYNVGIKYLQTVEKLSEKLSYSFDKAGRVTQYIKKVVDVKSNQILSLETHNWEYKLTEDIEIIYQGYDVISKIIKYDKLGNKSFEINNIDNCLCLADVQQMLKESLNLTLDSNSLINKKYKYNDIYDLPFKFASAVYNNLSQNADTYICLKIPEIFNGISLQKIYKTFDEFSLSYRNRGNDLQQENLITLNIDSRIFTLEAIGSGLEGNVFRISSGNKIPVILKIYYTDNKSSPSGILFGSSGLYGSLGILREANLANIVDIVDLYLANPIFKAMNNNNNNNNKEFRYVGGWQICEDANTRKKNNNNGLKFIDWLNEIGLVWYDNKPRHKINGIYFDTGYTTVPGPKCGSPLGVEYKFLHFLYSKYLNGETTQEIFDFLNKY